MDKLVRHPVFAPTVIFIIGVLTFLPSLSTPFVRDDEGQVLRNSAVKELNLGSIFGKGYWANVDEALDGLE